MAVAISPDGQLLVSGGSDGALYVWSLVSYCHIKTVPGHIGWVRSIVFNHDGTTVYSGSDDGTIKIWDVYSHTCIDTLRPPRPYEGMNITHATGLSNAQRETLNVLGARVHPLSGDQRV
jgi:WD40 repeat protein